MKTPINNPIKRFRSIIPILLTAFVLTAGCTGFIHHSDPLTNFHWSSLANLDNNKTVTDDYKGYIHTLSVEEQKSIAYIEYFEDTSGQHAVKITIGLNHRNWRHVLIYDKDNKRIKTIKYVSGNSMS